MKKVVNINLGNYPFTIDEDAYAMLSEYLNNIKLHFHDSEGRDEILEDIETGLAEIFREKMAGGQIVTMKEVNEAVGVMGTPEDFGAELPEEEPTVAATSSSRKKKKKAKKKSNYRTGKRLFRDSDDEVIAGVASGLSAYFGIQDPLWVRIGLVLLAFISIGVPAIAAYIILWIVVPRATTSADRLAMRGEPVNANNIGKVVEEELDKFGKRVDEWGDEVNDKWSSAKKKVLKSKASEGGFGRPLRKGFMF